MAGRIQGKVAVVTGAGRGIGAAIAERFATEGARVAVFDINEDNALAVAQQLSDTGHEALGIGGDAGVKADVDAAFDAVLDRFGSVDILVNNAALTTDVRHFFDGDEDWFDRYIRINLKSQYLCVDRAARIMARNGGGSIVNLSSGGGTKSHRGMAAYDTAKGGTEALTRAAAVELAPYGIRVNTLVPGLIATQSDEPEESRRLRDATVPLGRGGVAEDLAGPALFLVSDDAAYVTGTRVVVDGGVLVNQRSPQVETFPVDRFPDLDSI